MSASPTKKRKRVQLTLVSQPVATQPPRAAEAKPSRDLDNVIASIEAAEASRKDVTGATYFHPTRFELTATEDAVKHFNEHGYVVFRDVIGREEVKQALKLLWDWLEGLQSGLRREDDETWSAQNWPPALPGGIIPWLGIGHSKVQWFLRTQPGVKQAPEHETVNESSLPLHFDQNPLTKPGKRCMQGYINLLPTTPHTGGGTIIPGSHQKFQSFGEQYRAKMEALEGEDHFIFPQDDAFIKAARRAGGCKVPQLEAGDMFLWDSRTVHCSTAGSEVTVDYGFKPSLEEVKGREQEGRELGGHGLLRAVSFISMIPREQLKDREKIKEKRKEAVRRNITTSHWCTEFVDTSEYGAFDKYMTPRFKSITLPTPELTPAEQRMVV